MGCVDGRGWPMHEFCMSAPDFFLPLPVVEVSCILLGILLARFIGRGYAGSLMYVPGILGAILVNTLPSDNKIGLLFSYWVSSTCSTACRRDYAKFFSVFSICPFAIFLGWVPALTAGHTKRTYCPSNMIPLCSSLLKVRQQTLLL